VFTPVEREIPLQFTPICPLYYAYCPLQFLDLLPNMAFGPPTGPSAFQNMDIGPTPRGDPNFNKMMEEGDRDTHAKSFFGASI